MPSQMDYPEFVRILRDLMERGDVGDVFLIRITPLGIPVTHFFTTAQLFDDQDRLESLYALKRHMTAIIEQLEQKLYGADHDDSSVPF